MYVQTLHSLRFQQANKGKIYYPVRIKNPSGKEGRFTVTCFDKPNIILHGNQMEKRIKIGIIKRKGIKVEVIDSKVSMRTTTEPPLHTMRERGVINDTQYSAGNHLWKCVSISRGVTNSCEIRERVDGGNKEREITTAQVYAMQQVDKAIKATREHWPMIERVCVDEIPLTQRGMGGQERARLIYRFKLTLNDLAKVYGMM